VDESREENKEQRLRQLENHRADKTRSSNGRSHISRPWGVELGLSNKFADGLFRNWLSFLSFFAEIHGGADTDTLCLQIGK